ncbi:MAG: electron transfer flavoprotein subunit alpha/FixB family protein [Acidimicrobiia bacterium]|jgi:electron transfer flavoprotein alpha subunit|nr:electron transfer flavoprotein subunit alpha/FixB family protein [Acidimicrobiia bacterium]
MPINTVWVFAEAVDGTVRPISLELLAKARSLGTEVVAVLGEDAAGLADRLGEHGATKVLATGALDGRLKGPAVAAALAARIQSGDAPDVILFGTTYDGRDVMARLSVALDKPVLTNNSEIEADGDTLVVTTQIFGGSLLARTTFTGAGPYLISARSKSFPAEAVGGATPAVEAIEVPELGAAGAARVTAVHVEESSGPKLDEAAVVVSGGRGLGEAAKFEMVETLAKLLKGAPGASRAIVDAGWVPYSYQVGQTGKVVKPDVYIAAGISGATQHMVGMKGAKHIIAVNKDREAPIFGIADLGIVGDVHKVLPQLIEALQAR